MNNSNLQHLWFINPQINGLCKGISPQNMAKNMVQQLKFWVPENPIDHMLPHQAATACWLQHRLREQQRRCHVFEMEQI
jgi:hypothetical protein